MPEHHFLNSIQRILDNIQKHIESIAKQYQAKESREKQSGIQVGIGLPVEVSEYYRSEQAGRPQKEFRDKVRLGLEIIIALATITTLIIFARQLIEMRKQTQAAITAATTAQQQLRENHNALIQVQRAWVGPSQPIKVVTYNLGPPQIILSYQVFLKNFGPTVALNVIPAVSAAPGINRLDQTMDVNCESAERLSKGDLPPGQQQPIPGGRLGQTLFTNEERTIPYGSSEPSDPTLTTLYIAGCISYRDQFDIRHRTRFCFETPRLAKDFTTNQALVHCNVYNDAN